MTKKHFEAFAEALRGDGINQPGGPTLMQRLYAARLIARVARSFNPAFDTARFWKACGLDGMPL